MNYDAKKLTDLSVVKIFILASLCKWDNLRVIETGIRSNKELQKEIRAESNIYSQASRRLIELNKDDLADVHCIDYLCIATDSLPTRSLWTFLSTYSITFSLNR